jgi:hypothetical protein
MNTPGGGEISLLAAILRGQPALDGSCKTPSQRGGSCGHESGCDVRHYAKGLCQRHYREAENAKKRERRAAARGLEGEQRSEHMAVAS